MKVHDERGKWLLHQLLNNHVPAALIDRPKMGFGAPIAVWLRAPLRGWAEDLLDKKKLEDQGFVNPELHSQTMERASLRELRLAASLMECAYVPSVAGA